VLFPWNRILQKLTVAQPAVKLLFICGIGMFITEFKRARQWVLFTASLIHIVTSYVYDIHFSVILSHLSASLKRFSFMVFQKIINFSYLYCVLYNLLIYYFWIDHRGNIWWRKNLWSSSLIAQSAYSNCLRAGRPRHRSSNPDRIKNVLCSGAHPASYPMVTGGSFPGCKAAGAWSW
jgi:ABC-type uncharacterized transport system fused permease/ATPase subunit